MNKTKTKKSNGKWYFLVIVLVLLLTVYLVDPDKIEPILRLYTKTLSQIAPIFLLVYVIMLLTNYFVNNETLQKHLGKDAGFKAWLIAIVSGMLSIGPVYMWYPLMHDLQTKGVKDKFIATFLYNRGIKLQWLPMLILYFGLKYSLTVLLVMIILSIPQGILTEKMIQKIKLFNHEKNTL